MNSDQVDRPQCRHRRGFRRRRFRFTVNRHGNVQGRTMNDPTVIPDRIAACRAA